jgi:hypothetical protein
VSSILSRILCNAGLVAMNYFHLCLSWKIFISPLILTDNFAAYNSFAGHFFSFSGLEFHIECSHGL